MARYWCSSCRIFIADNKISRTQHETSSRHKSGVSKVIKGIHIKNRTNEILTQQAERELNRIKNGGNLRESYSNKTKEVINSDIDRKEREKKLDQKPNNEKKPVHEATIGQWVLTPMEPTVNYDTQTFSSSPGADSIQSSKVLSKGQKEINEWCLDESPKLEKTSTEKPQFRKRKIRGQRRENAV